MPNVGERLLRWWKSASTQARWVAGIVLFSLICTAALLLIADAASGKPSSAASDLSPWFYLDAVLKLLFVIGLFIGGAIITRHYSGKKIFHDSSRQLEVLETVRLSPRQALHLVRVGERSILIGATDQSFSLLTDLGQQQKIEEQAALSAAPETFQSVLELAAQKAQ